MPAILRASGAGVQRGRPDCPEGPSALGVANVPRDHGALRPPRGAGGDGWRRPGHARQDGDEGHRQEGPAARRGAGAGRLRRRHRRRLPALRALREEAQGARPFAAARLGGAREAVAHGPLPAPARGAAHRGRQGTHPGALRRRRRHRAGRGEGRRRGGGRLRRPLRHRRGAGAARPFGAAGAAGGRGGAPARRRDLHLHQHPPQLRGALAMPEPRDLTPKEIVAELDRYIIGQSKAKKAVAIALRNRWRRQRVAPELKDEILPKNIIMIGPTGVGKTEIARRLARLAGSPFVKVEASKFTEVGYVGRDVDSMVRDLVEAAGKLVKEEELLRLRDRAREQAEEKVLDALGFGGGAFGLGFRSAVQRVRGEGEPERAQGMAGRDRARAQLRAGTLDDEEVEVEVAEKGVPFMPIMAPGMEDTAQGLNDMMSQLGNNPLVNMLGGGNKKRKRKLKVKDALEVLTDDEASRLVDMERVTREALDRAQNAGIIFIDEIDKIAGREGGHGPDVSRGGVQRDLLPVVEGSNVTTKYGMVKTDHVLFIAAGAFHVAKVSDLIPELQGRFPIRVELEPLRREDLVRILKEPRNSLVKQYVALLATEGVDLQIGDDAVEEIARVAAEVNDRMENIGARRLHTVMERLLDEVSFDAEEKRGQRLVIDPKYVRERLEGVLADEDLSRYIL